MLAMESVQDTCFQRDPAPRRARKARLAPSVRYTHEPAIEAVAFAIRKVQHKQII